MWSLAVQKTEIAHAPTDDEWELARQVVRDGWQQGDVLRTAPFWADSARVGMYDYAYNAATEAEDEELHIYDRVWILADAEHAEQAEERLPDNYHTIERWQPSEHTRVLLVDVPDHDRVLYDVVERIAEARVVRDHGDRQESCELFHNDGWHCGLVDQYVHVSRALHETGGSLHRCIYVGLPPAAEFRVTWESVELGGAIRGNVGTTTGSLRGDRGSDVDFRVELDGDTLFDLVVGKWSQRFYPFDIDTRAEAGQAHDLSFVFGAEDFLDRWVCFRARVMRE